MFPSFAFNCLLRYNISSTEQNSCCYGLSHHRSSEQTRTDKREKSWLFFLVDSGGGRKNVHTCTLEEYEPFWSDKHTLGRRGCWTVNKRVYLVCNVMSVLLLKEKKGARIASTK
jgi:hypothetical protein